MDVAESWVEACIEGSVELRAEFKALSLKFLLD